jgi:hypothetical protein
MTKTSLPWPLENSSDIHHIRDEDRAPRGDGEGCDDNLVLSKPYQKQGMPLHAFIDSDSIILYAGHSLEARLRFVDS